MRYGFDGPDPCTAHVLLDGQSVYCTHRRGHEGTHRVVIAKRVIEWEPAHQPESGEQEPC